MFYICTQKPTYIKVMIFENRNNSSVPIIKRLDYKGVYIYVIHAYTGCNCHYAGCDSYRLCDVRMKVRDYSGNIIKSVHDRNSVNLFKNEINEYKAIEIFNLNYKIN